MKILKPLSGAILFSNSIFAQGYVQQEAKPEFSALWIILCCIAVVFFLWYNNSRTGEKMKDAATLYKMEQKLKEKKELEDYEKAKAFVDRISNLSYNQRLDEVVKLSNENQAIFNKIKEHKLLDDNWQKS